MVGRGSSSCSSPARARGRARGRAARGRRPARAPPGRDRRRLGPTQPAIRRDGSPGLGRNPVASAAWTASTTSAAGRVSGRSRRSATSLPSTRRGRAASTACPRRARLVPASGTRSSGWAPSPTSTTSYYEHWMSSIETRGIEHGRFTRADLDAAEARIAAGEPVPRRLDPEAAGQPPGRCCGRGAQSHLHGAAAAPRGGRSREGDPAAPRRPHPLSTLCAGQDGQRCPAGCLVATRRRGPLGPASG